MIKRIAVLTSGGDAPGMNAAIRAVVRKAIFHGIEVFGVERGYAGLIAGQIKPMSSRSVAGTIQNGGTMLKTARSEAFKTHDGFAEGIRQLQLHNIDCLVVIGGDGSMAGAKKLTGYGINTIVIPATIDNDMIGTEYTLGFDTALNTVLDATNKIRDTAESHERIGIIEVMGRNAGHIALMAGLACGAEVILVPEKPLDIDKLCSGLIESHQKGKLYSLIIVAEGVAKGYDIADQIDQRTKFKPHVTVLGYIQRGGSPTAYDNIIACRMGALAVDSIIDGNMNCLIAYRQGQVLSVTYDEAEQFKPVLDTALHELAETLSRPK